MKLDLTHDVIYTTNIAHSIIYTYKSGGVAVTRDDADMVVVMYNTGDLVWLAPTGVDDEYEVVNVNTKDGVTWNKTSEKEITTRQVG
jgi:acetylglutamate kinase